MAVFSVSKNFDVNNICGVARNNRHPIAAAVLYFSMSFKKPEARLCRPSIHTPPSTSIAILCAGIA